MTPLHQRAGLLRAYHLLPHELLQRAMAGVARAERPRFAVRAAVALWTRLARIDRAEFEPGPFPSLQAFFLRRLRAGARPIDRASLLSPVDGTVVAEGAIARHRALVVKGRPQSLARLVNGGRHQLPLDALEGGRFVSIFLSPRGYHRVHMPLDGELLDVRWIPGRFFPQNERALAAIPRVYERNERAVLRLRGDDGAERLLVMVGASLVGGIEIAGVPRARWVGPTPAPLGLRRERGDEIGHFELGSTVVLLSPPGVPLPSVREGEALRMGQPLVGRQP